MKITPSAHNYKKIALTVAITKKTNKKKNYFLKGLSQQEKYHVTGLTETELEVMILSFNSALARMESLFPTEEMGNPLSLVSSWELSI